MSEELFPLVTSYEEIASDRLGDFPSAQPTAKMVESVRRLGILQPILVRQEGTILCMVAGRRRLNAARKAGLKTVPVRIFPAGFSNDDILSLVENENRRENPVSDLRAVEKLLADGMTEEEIAQETGISVQRMKKILSLRNLIKPLRRAFEDGLIRFSVAEKAAKKGKVFQQTLLDILEKEGVIRVKDLVALSKVTRKTTVAALPDSLFGDVVPGWKESAKSKLEEVKKLAEMDAEKGWMAKLEKLLEELT